MVKLKYVYAALFSLFLISGGACFAAAATDDSMDEALDSIGDFTGALATSVTAMTAVAITPAGISASVRAFRHIVLGNV